METAALENGAKYVSKHIKVCMARLKGSEHTLIFSDVQTAIVFQDSSFKTFTTNLFIWSIILDLGEITADLLVGSC
jgi:hypothetical protein